MKPTTRVLLPLREGGFHVLELPTRALAMSLFNDAEIPVDGSPKTLSFPDAWANGDGVEIVVRRTPAVTCIHCNLPLSGVREGRSTEKFILYDRDCRVFTLTPRPCETRR